MSAIRISKQVADLSEETLRFYRQAGVEEVSLPPRYVDQPRPSRQHVPPTQTSPAGRQPPAWTVAELRRMVERAAAFGLRATTIALPISGAVLMGLPGREADLETIRRALDAAGRAGLEVATYSFTALRASEGYFPLDGAGRGGAHLRGFDYDRIRDLPPYPSVGSHSREQMWDRLVAFLRAVVPSAEAAGLRLALHPNDPPVPVYRGVAQPARTLQDWESRREGAGQPAGCADAAGRPRRTGRPRDRPPAAPVGPPGSR
jgi:mannonate dehydratase